MLAKPTAQSEKKKEQLYQNELETTKGKRDETAEEEKMREKSQIKYDWSTS